MRRTGSVLLLAGLLLLASCSDDNQSDADATMPTEAPGVTSGGGEGSEPEGTETFTDLEQTHVDTPVNYPQTPPVGGPHSPAWQTCGFYDATIMTERGVHSMEHGAVWITYSPDLASDQIEVLKTLQAGGKEVLVSPFEGLPTPIVASAWGKQLQLESTDDARLAAFVSFFDDGPQTPELDTPCAEGTDETVG
jgi:Protein of unknown function (DUF3105)